MPIGCEGDGVGQQALRSRRRDAGARKVAFMDGSFVVDPDAFSGIKVPQRESSIEFANTQPATVTRDRDREHGAVRYAKSCDGIRLGSLPKVAPFPASEVGLARAGTMTVE